ncbi:MAG: DUF4865 family protein [Alphaproteobacteria bacterium]|nr:DUF4865 family protein [Alphaproteobacteria bacterium]
MVAMQYTIHLPRDYDSALIRARVEQRSKLFDNLPGLAHKTFLFSEQDNIYAPFYIWKDYNAAQKFLMDDLFKGVIETFSRPRVRTWSVLASLYGNRAHQPTFCVMEGDLIAPDEKLPALLERERKNQEKLKEKHDGLYFHAIALDADRWEIIRYSLWRDRKSAAKLDADIIQHYDVLHVSEPK